MPGLSISPEFPGAAEAPGFHRTRAGQLTPAASAAAAANSTAWGKWSPAREHLLGRGWAKTRKSPAEGCLFQSSLSGCSRCHPPATGPASRWDGTGRGGAQGWGTLLNTSPRICTPLPPEYFSACLVLNCPLGVRSQHGGSKAGGHRGWEWR